MDRRDSFSHEPNEPGASRQDSSSDTSLNRSDSNSSKVPTRRSFAVELAGLVVLVSGLVGYAIYESMQSSEPPFTTVAKPTPSPSPTKSVTTRKPSTEPMGANSEIYQRAPKTGVYYAVNPILNSSRREIASRSGRFCIKIVNGPPAPMPGQQQVLISSLSMRSNGIFVDATEEPLQFDNSQVELRDGRGKWQLLEGKPDRVGALEECLNSTKPFKNEAAGDYIQGSGVPSPAAEP